MSNKIWYDESTKDHRREYIRREMVDGDKGFIAEDLDLILRVYGDDFQTDYLGKFRMVELKFHEGTFNSSQQKTLGIMDRMLKQSPESFRYGGFFMVYTETENWNDLDVFTVNGWDLTKDQFNRWLEWKLEIPSLSPFNQIPLNTWKWHKGPFCEGSNLES